MLATQTAPRSPVLKVGLSGTPATSRFCVLNQRLQRAPDKGSPARCPGQLPSNPLHPKGPGIRNGNQQPFCPQEDSCFLPGLSSFDNSFMPGLRPISSSKQAYSSGPHRVLPTDAGTFHCHIDFLSKTLFSINL